MKIEQEGYEYRGFRLGDVVRHKKTGGVSRIIGFNHECDIGGMFISIQSFNNIYGRLINSLYTKTMSILKEHENSYFCWVDCVQIEIIEKCEELKVLSWSKARELMGSHLHECTGNLLTGDLSISEKEINKIKLSGALEFVKVVKEIIEHKDKDLFELCLNNEKWVVLIEDKKYCVCDYGKKIIRASYCEIFEIAARILYDEKKGDF